MKLVFSIIIVFLFILVGCKNTNYIDTKNTAYINPKDDIDDKDELIIKEFRSHHDYSNDELKSLEIKYLGIVDNYKIYYVPYKVENEFGNAWAKEGYTFPLKSQTRIVGIKLDRLYTIGELIHETQINIKQLYEVLPEEFKAK